MKLNIIFGHCNRSNYCLQMYISHSVKYLKIQPTKNNCTMKLKKVINGISQHSL